MFNKNLNLIKAIFHFNFRIPFILWRIRHISDDEFYPYYMKLVNELLNCLKVNIKLEGIENLTDIDSNFFVVSNHRGMVDPVIISKIFTFKHPLSYIMKSSLSSTPIIKDISERTSSKYLERNPKDDLKTILEIIELQKNGQNYLIFPEGTRNTTEENLLAFKAASFKIPLKAKSTIIPIALYNTENIFEKKYNGKTLDIYMKIFKPIPYEEYKDLKTPEISKKIEEEIDEFISKVRN